MAKGGMFEGINVSSNAMFSSFAGGNDLDALPGRLESLIFPQRQVHRQTRKHTSGCPFRAGVKNASFTHFLLCAVVERCVSFEKVAKGNILSRMESSQVVVV